MKNLKMHSRPAALCVGLLVFGAASAADLSSLLGTGAPHGTVALDNAQATVCFSPDGCGEELIVEAIDHAQQQILVQAYGFSNRNILWALGKAKARKVDVEVIVDKSDEATKGRDYLAGFHVPVWIDTEPAIAHNKVMIIDGTSVITGSFNFTYSAQAKNAENVLFLQNVPTLAKLYTDNWNWRKSASRVFSQ